jgi:hypothetical protein
MPCAFLALMAALLSTTSKLLAIGNFAVHDVCLFAPVLR